MILTKGEETDFQVPLFWLLNIVTKSLIYTMRFFLNILPLLTYLNEITG